MKEINLASNLKQSLVFFLKEKVLRQAGYIQDFAVELGVVIKDRPYTICAYDMVYTDEYENPHNYIYAKSNNIDIDSSNYSINYITNEIVFNSNFSNVVVGGKFYTARVIDAFPETEDTIKNFIYSIISLDVDSISTSDFSIGVGMPVFWKFNCFIDLFARTENDRFRIIQSIMSLLKKDGFKLLDFEKGYVLKEDGTLNESFNIEEWFVCQVSDNGNPEVELEGVVSFDKIKRHRASLSFVSKVIF